MLRLFTIIFTETWIAWSIGTPFYTSVSCCQKQFIWNWWQTKNIVNCQFMTSLHFAQVVWIPRTKLYNIESINRNRSSYDLCESHMKMDYIVLIFLFFFNVIFIVYVNVSEYLMASISSISQFCFWFSKILRGWISQLMSRSRPLKVFE